MDLSAELFDRFQCSNFLAQRAVGFYWNRKAFCWQCMRFPPFRFVLCDIPTKIGRTKAKDKKKLDKEGLQDKETTNNNSRNYFRKENFIPLKPCILQNSSHTPSSGTLTPLLSSLCHQSHAISIQYITTVYHIFRKLKLVLYTLYQYSVLINSSIEFIPTINVNFYSEE